MWSDAITNISDRWIQKREEKAAEKPVVMPWEKAKGQTVEVEDEPTGITEEMSSIEKRFEEGTLVTTQEPGQARSGHLRDLTAFENAQKEGLVKSSTGNKWMPIKSGEGRGPDKNMSFYEIGHGIKIHEDWLGTDKSKWPTVKGVKVDVSQGLTEDQEEAFVGQLLDKSYVAAKEKISTWDDLSENAKVFWGDLAYNGGAGAIDKNPKAKAAVENGYSVEGMILALDYIGSAGKPSRGLLNRRISMYNQAASEINGAPIIEEYKFGDEIKVKFAHGFMTEKVSKGFKKKQGDELWRTILDQKGKFEGKEVSRAMDQEQKFRG